AMIFWRTALLASISGAATPAIAALRVVGRSNSRMRGEYPLGNTSSTTPAFFAAVIARTPMRKPSFNRAMSRGSDSMRKSMSDRLSDDDDSRTQPVEYDLLTQNPR